MSIESDIELSRKVKELEDLNRVLSNGLNWLADTDVKVAYIQPIAEFIGFLNGFKQNINQQQAALAAVAPKVVETKIVEPVIVS